MSRRQTWRWDDRNPDEPYDKLREDFEETLTPEERKTIGSTEYHKRLRHYTEELSRKARERAEARKKC